MMLIELLTEFVQQRSKGRRIYKIFDIEKKGFKKCVCCGCIATLLEQLSKDCLYGNVVNVYEAKGLFNCKRSNFICIEIKRKEEQGS